MEIKDYVKLSKEEVNEIFEALYKDNKVFSLILKLIYIYGRNVSEVENLHKRDIDFEKGTIKFIMNGDELVYPIHETVEEDLKAICEWRNKLLFDSVKDGINYSFYKKTENLKKLPFLKGVKLTTRDFKILRGQHLFMDGVDIKTIHKFYHNTNADGTKKFINYSELNKLLYTSNVDDIFTKHTNLNIFYEHGYVNPPVFYVTDNQNRELFVILNEGDVEVDGDLELENKFNDLIAKVDIVSELSALNKAGQYIIIDGLKFLRN